MDPIGGLVYGFIAIFTPETLLAAALGALLGTAIGVLPGLGPVGGAALILPLTFGLSPVTGIVALGAIYYGAMYGGSTTSILLNMPGESASVVTAIDGFEMTKRGRAGAALSIVAIGSFVAATLSLVGMLFATPALANVALAFGPAEFFALTVVGLLLLASITGGSVAASVVMVAVGLMLGTIGFDSVNGTQRFTFGNQLLVLGVDLVPAAVGLFGLAEIFLMVERHSTAPRPIVVKLRQMLPTRDEMRSAVPAWLRGTGIGFGLGLLPGPSPTLASFISYRLEKIFSRDKGTFGRGAVAGVAGPEAANNAAATTSFIPLLALGLPFTPTLALILAAMQIQGVQPGPLLIRDNPDIFWGIIASMFLGNAILLLLNLPLVGIWVSVLRVPKDVLIVGIVIATVIGSYSVRNSMFDVYVLVGFGVLGYILRKIGVSPVPLILALVLGPLIEKYLLEGLYLGSGDVLYFVSSPLAISIWAIGLAGLVAPVLYRRIVASRAKDGIESSEPESTSRV